MKVFSGTSAEGADSLTPCFSVSDCCKALFVETREQLPLVRGSIAETNLSWKAPRAQVGVVLFYSIFSVLDSESNVEPLNRRRPTWTQITQEFCLYAK